MSKRRLPINFLDQSIWTEVAADTWRTVLDTAGETARLTGEAITANSLLESLQVHEPSDALQDAMSTIYELRSDQGRDLIFQAAADQQQAISLNQDLPIAEFCAQLWVLSRRDKKLCFVLERARVNITEQINGRTSREFACKGDATAATLDKEKLKKSVEAWYEKNEGVTPVGVFIQKHGDEYFIEIVKGEPIKRVSEVKNDEVRPLEFRPAGSDVLRYDQKLGRIGIATRSTRLLQGYRKLLGDVIGGSEDFFSNENVCSLVELRNQKGKLFERSFQGILRVEVKTLVWRRGERDTVFVRARDCFQTLESMKASLVEGELIEAKLKVSFSGGAKPGTVSLKVPNRIDIDAGVNEPLVEQMLDEVGIRGAFEVGGERKNFWSRYPWKMSETDYRRWLTREFDRLVNTQVIRKARLDFVTHPDHPAAKDALEVVDLDASTTVGVSQDAAVATRTLTPTDTAGFELNLSKLAGIVASTLKLEGDIKEVMDGVWSLGSRQLTQAKVVSIFLLSRQPTDRASIARLVASNGNVPILLVPDCCSFDDSGVITIPCKLPAGSHNQLSGSIIKRLGVESQFNPPDYMSQRLIIDTRKGEVWLDGVLTTLKPETHGFTFVRRLASTPGQVVKNRELEKAISSNRSDGETPKKARSQFADSVRKSFSEQKLDPPNLDEVIDNRGGGYILLCEVAVL